VNSKAGLPSFVRDFVHYDPRDYVTVVSSPFQQKGEVYEVKDSAIGNALPGDPDFNIRFLNLNSEQMQDLVMKSIDGGQPVWFGADVMKDFDPVRGILHPDLFKHDSLYSHQQGEAASPLSQFDQLRLQLIAPTHAMSFIGYDRPDPTQPPVKFLDENSWGQRTDPAGEPVAPNGNLHVYRQWFDKYVFVVMINKKFLPPEFQQKWSGQPHEISHGSFFDD
jgi:bleomycin hydrolase